MVAIKERLVSAYNSLLGNIEPTIEMNPTAEHQAAAMSWFSPPQLSSWTGDKFPGGYGNTNILQMDYWELRAKSAELFRTNLYARGLIRRLVTNEINTGLCLEAIPDCDTLGRDEDQLADWAEDVERRFELWGNNKVVCDYLGEQTFAQLQDVAREESIIEGDILVVRRVNPATNMPQVQLISGSKVVTPLMTQNVKLRKGHTILHGVERDAENRVVAYWIRQKKGDIQRLAAYGSKTGRRVAWLVFGTDKRKDDVRGEPLLGIILQSLKEIDRYRDSTQRRAVMQSILAMFIKKGEDKPGTHPMTGGAVRKQTLPISGDASDTRNEKREWRNAQHIPGLVLEELQTGEEPQAFKLDANGEHFATFESAMIQAVAWANQIPPEILQLAFSNNYSASQAAINEFKIYLNKIRKDFGTDFCQPFYIEWLIAETLLRKVTAPGFIQAWRDPAQYETYGAWIASDWSGAIKPSTDIKKQADGMKKLTNEGWITNARAARELTGTKFSRNAKIIRKENELKVEAMRPIAEFEQKYRTTIDQLQASLQENAQLEASDELIEEVLERIREEMPASSEK